MRKILKKFLNKIIFAAIILAALYFVYSHNGLIELHWLGYTFYSSVAAIVLLILLVLVLRYVLRTTRKTWGLFFGRYNLKADLAKYTKNLDLSTPVQKEIENSLSKEIRDYKSLQIFSKLNHYIADKEYLKIAKIVKKHRHKTQWRSLLNYIEVKSLLSQGKLDKALQTCRHYLELDSSASWAFLMISQLALRHKLIHYLEFLHDWAQTHRVKAAPLVLDKIYCLINYTLITEQPNTAEFVKRLKHLIKRYPTFTPAYTALAKHYARTGGGTKEAVQLIVKSWYHNITYENTVSCDNLFLLSFKEDLIGQAKNLLNNMHTPAGLDRVRLLLVVLYAAYGDFMNVRTELLQIETKSDYFYKVVQLYVQLKEHYTGVDLNLMLGLASDLAPMSWWNAFSHFAPQ